MASVTESIATSTEMQTQHNADSALHFSEGFRSVVVGMYLPFFTAQTASRTRTLLLRVMHSAEEEGMQIAASVHPDSHVQQLRCVPSELHRKIERAKNPSDVISYTQAQLDAFLKTCIAKGMLRARRVEGN